MSLRNPPQDASGPAGATVTYTAADVAGDTCTGAQGRYLHYRNASGGAITVTLATPETVEGNLTVQDRAVSVAAGTDRVIPVPSRYNDATTGLASITYSGVTSLTVAFVQGPVTP